MTMIIAVMNTSQAVKTESLKKIQICVEVETVTSADFGAVLTGNWELKLGAESRRNHDGKINQERAKGTRKHITLRVFDNLQFPLSSCVAGYTGHGTYQKAA